MKKAINKMTYYAFTIEIAILLSRFDTMLFTALFHNCFQLCKPCNIDKKHEKIKFRLFFSYFMIF